MTNDTRTTPRNSRLLMEVLHPQPRMEQLEPRLLLDGGGIEVAGVPADTGVISGLIYVDLNGSTTFSTGEPGLAGGAVQLFDGEGTLLDTILTPTGTYAFTDLAGGNYEVRLVDLSTWVQTGPAAMIYSIALADGQEIENINFGVAEYCTIRGQKFNDLDANRQWDPAETAMNGWTIDLYDAQGALVATRETATARGNDGSYMFSDLLPGTYEVREVAQVDWRQTAPLAQERVLTLTSGQHMTGLNIGNTQVLPLPDSETAAISGLVFEDLNGSRSHDAGEPGLGQHFVQLRDGLGTVLQTIQVATFPAGTYAFTGLAAGDYQILVPGLTTYIQTTPIPTTFLLTLADGQQAPNVNFGIAEYATVSGRKFNDVNADGVMGAGESGLNGWTIELYDTEGGLVGSQTTATAGQNAGSYMFSDLLPGTYELREVVQSGWVQTAPLPPTQWVTPTSGQDLGNVNVGNRRLADAVNDYTTIIDLDNPTPINVLANDLYIPYPTPPGVITGVTNGANGTVTIIYSGLGVAYQPNPSFTGNDSFTYSVTDAGIIDTATVNVTVVDTNPGGQEMHHATDQVQLDLPQTTVRGQSIVYSAVAFTPDAYVRRLQQQVALTVYLWPWDNWHGHQEKWLQDADKNWFYMLPDGGFYRGGTNELIAQIGQIYYDDPWRIINGLPGALAEPDVAVGAAGDQLTVDPPAGFVGVVIVELTATFSFTTVVSQFEMAVTNTLGAPGVVDQDMSHLDDTLDLPPQPTDDGQGEAVTYSATLALPAQAAYNIRQGLNLASYVPLFDNYRNLNEKWFLDDVGNWYYILDNGGVFHPATALPVGRVSQEYYNNPQAIIEATEPLPLASYVTVAGNQVTVNPDAAYAGWLQIEVRVHDGAGWAATTIQVQVTNILPDLSFLTDQQMVEGRGPLVISLPQTDGESENVTYGSTFGTAAVTAYQLDRDLGLVGHWSLWDNHFGQGAKWLWDGAGQWYYLLPGGQLYRDGSGELLGQVATSYYNNPATLVNAPVAELPNVALALNGSLVIAPDAGVLGTFQINVEANDTIQTTDRTFDVTIVPNVGR